MIVILNRWTRAQIYKSETAQSIAEAVSEALNGGAYLSGADLSRADLSRADLSRANLSRAYLSRANLSGANLSGANLSRADLSGANLSGANLSGANLSGADLSGADLSGANLSGADLSGAYLGGADLSGANLSGAMGVDLWRTSSLAMLRDQPGKIRAYKLVDVDGRGPHYPSITYTVGESYSVPDANTAETVQCGRGINVASMDWILREYVSGQRILVVEFEAADIAAIPLGTDGKFRLHRCTVVAEKDLKEFEL